MGNFSSSSCSAAAPTLSVKSSALVSRVLLIDGSMLKFGSPIKVIHLLLDYPNHCICPLDSLKPGLHSLSALLPDEKLQLGRLYLLLPFKTHMQQQQQQQQKSCIKSKQSKRQHTLDPKMLLRERGIQAHLKMIREPDQERARLLPRDKSNVGLADCEKIDAGFAKCDEFTRIGGTVGSSLPREEHILEKKLGRKDFCKIDQTKEKEGFMGSSKFADLNKSSDVGLRYSIVKPSAASYNKLNCQRRRGKESSERGPRYGNKCENVSTGPLCDTPELQRAYRSFLLRRSSTWTPRLQPIIERR